LFAEGTQGLFKMDRMERHVVPPVADEAPCLYTEMVATVAALMRFSRSDLQKQLIILEYFGSGISSDPMCKWI
jgi:hypothetical protein